MIDLYNVQSKANDLIGAVSYIDGVTVLMDDGEQNDAAGLARRSNGVVIIIRQPDSFTVSTTANGIAFGSASITVQVSFNMEVNVYGDAGAGLDPERASQEIKRAMEAYDADSACSFFQFAGESLLQTEGLYERQLTFTAWVTA